MHGGTLRTNLLLHIDRIHTNICPDAAAQNDFCWITDGINSIFGLHIHKTKFLMDEIGWDFSYDAYCRSNRKLTNNNQLRVRLRVISIEILISQILILGTIFNTKITQN